jgi:hypothetical protein
MAEAVPNEKLRQYLRELKPEARALLAAELEKAQLRGENPPGASMILEELRADARENPRRPMPQRLGNPQRLFFQPLEPFLVDDSPERKHRGRISRACLDPIWSWISRDLVPQESKSYNAVSPARSAPPTRSRTFARSARSSRRATRWR